MQKGSIPIPMEKALPTKSHNSLSASTSDYGSHWELLQRQCKAFLESGFLPSHVKTIAQAVTIAWKGHELGIPPLAAFSGIGVIAGKPVLSAELMMALILRDVKGAKITFLTPLEKQAMECTVEMQRPGGQPQQFKFSIEDAKKAGLVRPGSGWEKYPDAMLRARAITKGAKAVFADAISGMGGTLSDLDTKVATVVDGELIDVTESHEKPVHAALLEE